MNTRIFYITTHIVKYACFFFVFMRMRTRTKQHKLEPLKYIKHFVCRLVGTNPNRITCQCTLSSRMRGGNGRWRLLSRVVLFRRQTKWWNSSNCQVLEYAHSDTHINPLFYGSNAGLKCSCELTQSSQHPTTTALKAPL